MAPINGWNPPVPVPKSDEKSFSNNIGQRLLSLVRSLEKKADEQHGSRLETAVELLNNLIETYSRRGILEGNMEKAEHILATQKSNPREKQRGNKKASVSNDLQLNYGEDGNVVESTVQQDETFVFSAVLRILGTTPGEETTQSLDEDGALLIQLAAELVVALTERVKSVTEVDTCILAEYELLAQHGKPILTGLFNTMQLIDSDIQAFSRAVNGSSSDSMARCLAGAVLDEKKHAATLISCLKASSSLVSLFGTKLSRSTILLADLKKTAWRFVTLPTEEVQRSAARLVAAVPLAGGTERKTPSNLWNVVLVDAVSSLSTMLEVVAPLNKSSRSSKSKKVDDALSKEMAVVLQGWADHLKQDISQEEARINAFSCCIRGLTLCFQSLLTMDCLKQKADSVLLEARLDVASILDLVESFLSFPLSAEGVYYRTKKRLRSEAVDGGLLNPSSLAVEVASRIKLSGHDILDSLISAAGGSVLLPHARRIIRMGYAALLTSSSGTLRKVLDPTNAVQMDGKKRRWLHTSIPLRTRAIKTCKNVTLAFGSDKSGKASSYQSSNRLSYGSSDGERAAALIGGCLVEQVNWDGTHSESEDDWGSLAERVELVTLAAEALAATLVSCGGFLSASARGLTDSIATTGLSSMTSDNPNSLFSCSPVKVALLDLASTCLATPWADGAASSIVENLTQAARKCESDRNIGVVVASKAALRVCDSFAVPRAPALLFVTRASTAAGPSAPQMDTSAFALIDNIQKSRSESLKAEKAKQAAEAERAKEQAEMERVKEKAEADRKKKVEEKRRIEKAVEPEMKRAKKEKVPEVDERVASPKNGVDSVLKGGVDSKEKQSDSEEPDRDAMEVEPPIVSKESKGRKPPCVIDSKPVAASVNADSSGDEEFPEIVEGGPDSDDE